MSIAYRRDVDGLRAVAVVPVVMFHAEVPGFDGGFVGVDVFFVISGFLIAGTILAEHARGTFSLARFYERRARRILPALAFVTAATLVPAFWLLSPRDLSSYAESLVGIVTLSSNLVFWQQGGYFGSSIEFKPLIHTWSLAVEEQFYLAFALVTVVLARRAPRLLMPSIVAATLASFALSIWLPARSPDANFYLLTSRAWEMLAGALVAWWAAGRHVTDPSGASLGERPVPGDGAREIGAGGASALSGPLPTLVGLALILGSVVSLDRGAHSPGWTTLAAVAGTALILALPDRRGAAGRLLGTAPLVGIGLVSYSLYLWHQPLLAFSRHAFGHLSGAGVVAVTAASVTLSALTWRWIERPWRDRQRISKARFARTTAACAAVFATIAATVLATGGVPQRLTPEQRRLVDFLDYDYAAAYRSGRCFSEPGEPVLDTAAECFSPPGAPVVFGDSHAAALAVGFAARGVPVTQLTRGACPPLLGPGAAGEPGLPPACNEHNRRALGRLVELRPDLVVLTASWRPHVEDVDLDDALDVTLDVLERELPAARVVVVGSLPHWSGSLPMKLLRAGRRPGTETRLSTHDYADRVAIDAGLAAVTETHGDAFVDLMRRLCDERGCLTGAERADGTIVPFAWDQGHPTRAAARMLACMVSDAIDDRPGTADGSPVGCADVDPPPAF